MKLKFVIDASGVYIYTFRSVELRWNGPNTNGAGIQVPSFDTKYIIMDQEDCHI